MVHMLLLFVIVNRISGYRNIGNSIVISSSSYEA
jgi:hypothetical protein